MAKEQPYYKDVRMWHYKVPSDYWLSGFWVAEWEGFRLLQGPWGTQYYRLVQGAGWTYSRQEPQHLRMETALANRLYTAQCKVMPGQWAVDMNTGNMERVNR